MQNDSQVLAIAKLCIGKEGNLQEIQERLRKNSSSRVEFVQCSFPVTDEIFTSHIVPLLSPDLISLSFSSWSITNTSVSSLTSTFPNLQQLKFINCDLLFGNVIATIGQNCPNLKSLSFVFDTPTAWSRSADARILSDLVRVCSALLNSLTFVGFDGLTDLEVEYMSECYGSSIRRLNLNRCRSLTDRSLTRLASRCKDLRDVCFNGTRVTDQGVVSLVSACSNLHRLDLGNCPSVGDASVKVVAEKCPRLERLCLENCSLVTEDSLVAVLIGCPSIQSINLNGTSLTRVPPIVLASQKLRHFSVENCRRLIEPPQGVTRLKQIRDYYKEYNAPFRLRVNFVGERLCGKTSVIHGLTSTTPAIPVNPPPPTPPPPPPTEFPSSTIWAPPPDVLSNINSSTGQVVDKPSTAASPAAASSSSSTTVDATVDSEVRLVLELVDHPGKQLMQSVNHLFFGAGDLYVVVFNVLDKLSCDKVASHVNAIQQKIPGGTIFVVGTHVDKLPQKGDAVDLLQKKLQDITYNIKDAEGKAIENIRTEMNALSQMPSNSKALHQVKRLQKLLKIRPKLTFPSHMFIISTVTSEGFGAFQSALLSEALTRVSQRHLGHETRIRVISATETLLQVKRSGKVILNWNEYVDLTTSKCDDSQTGVEKLTEFLHSTGILMELKLTGVRNSSEEHWRYVCLDPIVFGRLQCLLLLDGTSSTNHIRIDANRFWPEQLGWRRPRPRTLLRAIGDLTKRGLLRQVLLPILWQDYALSEDQTKDVVFILERLGFLVEKYQPPTTEVDSLIWKELIVHGYETLNPSTVYNISLLNLTSDKRPHINWNPRPSKGDMQVTWRYEFPNGLPHGLKNKMLTICQAVAYDRTYQYTWRDGVLFIMGEAAVCVEYETKRLDVSGRVNADTGGQESSSSEYLWSHMSVFLIAVQRLIESWPGLFYKVSLIPQGLPLFGGDVVAIEKSFCVYFAFGRSEKDENVRFTDGNVQRILDLKLLFPFPMKDFSSVDEWLRYLHRNRELVFSVMSNPVSTPVDQVLQSQRPTVTRHILTATVTSKKIKWEIDGDTSAEGADEADDDPSAADDISSLLFVRVALGATPFTKLQSSLDEGGQQMTTPRPDETVDSVENDEEEDNRSTTEVDDDEIVIRLSGFARAQNSTSLNVANGVLKQSTDEKPNQLEKLKAMLDQSTQTTRPLTDLLLSALTPNTTSSDYINATITQMERDSCNHSIETKFCTIF